MEPNPANLRWPERTAMRTVRHAQMEIGEARIEDIELNPKSWDDIPTLLTGLQHPYRNEETREALFALLERHVLPGRNRKNGRPGMGESVHATPPTSGVLDA